jgi:hypothetical protein
VRGKIFLDDSHHNATFDGQIMTYGMTMVTLIYRYKSGLKFSFSFYEIARSTVSSPTCQCYPVTCARRHRPPRALMMSFPYSFLSSHYHNDVSFRSCSFPSALPRFATSGRNLGCIVSCSIRLKQNSPSCDKNAQHEVSETKSHIHFSMSRP